MLDERDAAAVRRRFGATDEQVRRDHLIAHLLAALAAYDGGRVVFFGGTALSLSHLRDARLSEDVDLLAEPRRDLLRWLGSDLPRRLRREHPGLTWSVPPERVREPSAALLRSPQGLVVRVQVLALRDDWTRYPVEPTVLPSRYRDAAPAVLHVPTGRAFAVMKGSAWCDRHAARDLFDLAGLAGEGAVDGQASDLARAVLGRRLRGHDFTRVPADWQVQLAHQTRSLPDAAEALAVVRQAWEGAAGGRP